MSAFKLVSNSEFMALLYPAQETAEAIEKAMNESKRVCCVKHCSAPAVKWAVNALGLQGSGFCEHHLAERLPL